MNFMPQKLLSFKLFISLIFIFIFINLIILDFKIFNKKSVLTNTVADDNKSQLVTQPIPTVSTLCPNSCITKINEATTSIKLSQPINNQSQQKDTGSIQVSASSGVKEFFIPFGSGSNSTDDWADISGLQVYVDSSQYSQIKSVVFEASIRIPTGNETAYVRLFNATDKHPVSFSEVSLEGGTPQLLVSKPINLDSGKKLYQIQMKTSLKYTAILDQARLHITTY